MEKFEEEINATKIHCINDFNSQKSKNIVFKVYLQFLLIRNFIRVKYSWSSYNTYR